MSTPVRRGIYGRLSGDSTLSNLLGTAAPGYTKAIYHDPAPEGAQFPFVLISKSSGVPTESFGKAPSGGIAYETDVWLVKAVDHSSSADTADSIAARVQYLLNDAALSIAGGVSTMYLRRQSDVEYSEVVDGETYRHAGSLFRLVYS